jgi:SAM-dependent methyltransferase
MAKIPLSLKSNNQYDRPFFTEINPASLQSAEVILPILFRLLHPQSVVDVGCGTGSWLSVAKKLGITRVLGVDGDYIERATLMIDQEEFMPANLAQPLFLPETFDLAMCLEVAEHLLSRSARDLVGTLARLSPMIFFSAAIPGQYAPGHINLQWPAYWEKLFADAGYLMLDPIRPLIWQDEHVAWYYRQNCFLFARQSKLDANVELGQLAKKRVQKDLILINKDIFEIHLSLSHSIKRIPGLTTTFLVSMLKNLKGFFFHKG